jgi:metal-sulfur cluster biosynthetic enzyme
MNERDVRRTLDEIVDPCSAAAGAPAGIGELGLIRHLAVAKVEGGVSVEARIGVTEPGCLMGASFVVKARALLDAMPEVVSHDVGLDHAADWEPSDIDPAYAKRLAAVRSARPGGAVMAAAQPRTGQAAGGALS